jgi:hypothetical protein
MGGFNLESYIEKPSEALQILHHAYMYQFKKVLLLVGSKMGEIISGMWVSFGDTLLYSWGTYLKKNYELSTEWLYDPTRPQMPECELEWALNKSGVTEEEFKL